jgi:hypothetical protein
MKIGNPNSSQLRIFEVLNDKSSTYKQYVEMYQTYDVVELIR